MITVIDGMMGVGKTAYMTERIKRERISVVPGGKRYIILLPYIDFMQEYTDILGTTGIRVLNDDVSESISKTEHLKEALSDHDIDVIITTHQIYDYWDDTVDSLIKDGEWTLVIDEVPSIFETFSASVSHMSIKGLIGEGALSIEKVSDTRIAEGYEVETLTVTQTGSEKLNAPTSEVSKIEKDLIRKAQNKILYRITTKGKASKSWMVLSLNPSHLKKAKDAYFLTYLFAGSELEAWLKINELDHEHKKLERDSSILRRWNLTDHDRHYTGQSVKGLITIDDMQPLRKSEKTKPYAPDSESAYSVTDYKDNISKEENPQKVRGQLRRFTRYINFDDFMWTTFKNHTKLYYDKERGMSKKKLDGCFIPFNKTGVNDFDNKNKLAYLCNNYQSPEIGKLINSFGIDYSDRSFALSSILQWTFRSSIRKGNDITICIPSKRMREIIIKWLDGKLSIK